MGHLTIAAEIEVWPLASAFTISRGSKTEARVILVRVSDGIHEGLAECVPYARYGETPESVETEIIGAAAHLGRHADVARVSLSGAARNALDCAFWAYEAHRAGTTVGSLAGLPPLHEVTTAYTLSLAPPAAMAAAAAAVPQYPLLKLKLGPTDAAAAMMAVRAARRDARLIVDANEAWAPDDLPGLFAAAASAGVELIEQPLPAGQDDVLADIARRVPVCADESVHTCADLKALIGKYDAVNIKLDKTGGLTEALALKAAARAAGFKIMVGSMVATSLAVAPAFLIAQDAEWVDLDGPLLLARDRAPGFAFDGARMLAVGDGVWA